MTTRKQTPQPDGAEGFATRIWHWRKKMYLYAKDYGLKAFPIHKRK
jgi:hypothetical protein